jgi:radical SAM-linked protein
MRVRLRFSKLGKVRWTSHRDVARMWERALRRASVPVALSEGFSPRPKVSFGLALSTGHESLGEYLDVELAPGTTLDLDELPERLTPALPVGIDVQAAVALDGRVTSLQQEVVSCSWRIDLPELDPPEAEAAVAAALAAPSLVTTRTRKGTDVVDDVRPAILHLAVAGPSAVVPGSTLDADLATQPRSLRPAELVSAVLPGLDALQVLEARVLRTHQWIDHDGVRTEPIPLALAPPTSHLLGACG